MLAALIPGLSIQHRKALTAAAAAPDLQAGLAGVRGSHDSDKLHATLADRLWLVRPAVHDQAGVPRARSAIHPWVRTLLLAELARREDPGAPGWKEVHRALRSAADATEPIATRRLYHTLALGELAEVVRSLVEAVQRQPPADTQTWLTALNEITSAPAQRVRGMADESPGDRLDRLVADAVHTSDPPFGKEHRTTTTLVAALWLYNDPLFDPHRTLGSLVASKLRSVSDEIPVDAAQLDAAAVRYED
jgi:hypothetical protein